MANHQLAGATVLVADGQKVLAVDTAGYADIAASAPIQSESLFWIASMSKPITAAALMMLVDEGKVKVEDPVEKYLPEFKGQMVLVEDGKDRQVLGNPKRPITVHDVLSHTAGLMPRSPIEPEIDMLPLKDNVRVYPLVPLRFEPGTQYQYSNAGINTAGRIVEVVSGMPFEKFLDQRLFGPLGMSDTTFWPDYAQIKRLAKSYKPNDAKTGLEETTINQLTYPLTDRNRGVCPAGGLFSTAADVAKFGQLLLNAGVYNGKRLLSEAAVRQMSSNQTAQTSELRGKLYSYGFGLQVATKGPDEPFKTPGCFGHGGAYGTHLYIDTNRKLVAVYMIQHAGYFGDSKKKMEDAFLKSAGVYAGK